jgi:DNA repair exonuclease SbcCD ATPase subunit
MIIFQRISWCNFLSTGNHKISVDFREGSTNLIIGTNGSGKSTILDALTFSLFGKPFRRINKPQLVNSVNEKDCIVDIEFKIGSTEWKVKRGIKPSIFEIFKNGKLLDQSHSITDQQKWLEQNVLKMNYKSFTQIVILGSSTFVPFMQLSSSNRREVIEDLLDIKIFSSMNSVVKNKIRTTRDDIKILELKKTSLIDKVSMQENFIQEIEKDNNLIIESKKNKISKLSNEIDATIKLNSEWQNQINSLHKDQKKISGSNETLLKLNNLKGKISEKISSITKEHKFFTNNSVCPTCYQNIEDEFRLNRITDAENNAKKLKDGYEELKDNIEIEQERDRRFQALSKGIINLTHGISTNNSKINTLQQQIKDLENEIQTIAEKVQDRNTESQKLITFKENLNEVTENIISKKETFSNYEFIYSLLKDGGVKTKIIKKYIPIINDHVNKYLQRMDFYVNFTLDEEFNESMISPIHENFSYSSFSEGEKARINLALIFAWREIAKMKNSVNCNLILFDEVFDGSLDVTGTDDFLKIIRYILKDSNVFVISHKSGIEDVFDTVYKAEKQKGFSTLVKL